MMDDYPLTLNHLLERVEKLFPTVRVTTRAPDRSVRVTDYASVARRARMLAAAILDSGLRPGDRVGTLMWNHSTHLEAYLGIPASGAVLHTLNLRLPPEHLAYVINHAQDRWLLVDDILLPVLAKVRDQVHPERIFVVPFSGQKVPAGFEDYEEFLAGHRPAVDLPPRAERDASGLCYTSGTTGRLKGVLYSHRSIVLHSLATALGVGISQADSLLLVVPMFHANAWGMPYILAMLGARPVFPGPHLDPESLIDLMERESVTLAVGVPSIWVGIIETLEKHPDRWKLDPGLRMVIGGSAVPESMVRRFAKLGIRVVQGYGMTETAPVVTLSVPKAAMSDWDPDRLYLLQARQGMAIPFAEVRLRNEAKDLPWDGKSVGELQLRGPWVARRYYEDPDPRGKWTEDGWLRTGDVATIDAEGFVELVDRLKDLVKSGGEWISSVALENALVSHPGVREAAVIAVPSAKWGERPLAFVVVREGSTVPEAELRSLLEARYPKWWVPDEFRFVASLPKTSTGKISKLTLREEFAKSAGASAASR